MSNKEKLHFRIGISGTYWKRRPIYSILLNGTVVECREITADTDIVEHVEFEYEIEPGPAQLEIRLENKTQADTVQNLDKTEIINDMLLNVISVEIDDISLGNLIWTQTEFRALDTDRPTLKQCVNLGWNGSWILPFESPFYIWLLENI